MRTDKTGAAGHENIFLVKNRALFSHAFIISHASPRIRLAVRVFRRRWHLHPVRHRRMLLAKREQPVRKK